MTVHVLISGRLVREPEKKISASGRQYVRCRFAAVVSSNESPDFWDVLAFGETVCVDLQRLKPGDRCSLQGSLRLEIYRDQTGEHRISRKIFADFVLPLRAPPKAKKPRKDSSPASEPARVSIIPDATSSDGELNDDIPF